MILFYLAIAWANQKQKIRNHEFALMWYIKVYFGISNKFFMKEFRKDNKRIVKKRFKQVDAATVFEGFLKTCTRLFGHIPSIVQIAQLVMIISCVKPCDGYSYINRYKKRGNWLFKPCKYTQCQILRSCFRLKN